MRLQGPSPHRGRKPARGEFGGGEYTGAGRDAGGIGAREKYATNNRLQEPDLSRETNPGLGLIGQKARPLKRQTDCELTN